MPLAIALAAVTSHVSAQGRVLLTAPHLVVLAVVLGAAQWLFARRSSLGGLVAGLVALAVHVAVVLLPRRVDSLPFPWVRELIPTGGVLLLAAVLLGGAWGMRQARRRGREEARLSARLGALDRTMGRTPEAPPARRRDHLLSLVVTVVAVPLAMVYLRGSFPAHVAEGGPLVSLAAVAALVQVVVVTALAGLSSLGARATGAILLVAALPALVAGAWPGVPGHALLSGWYPIDSTGTAEALVALALGSAGWGAHLARRQGRGEIQAHSRGADTTTPPAGLPQS